MCVTAHRMSSRRSSPNWDPSRVPVAVSRLDGESARRPGRCCQQEREEPQPEPGSGSRFTSEPARTPARRLVGPRNTSSSNQAGCRFLLAGHRPANARFFVQPPERLSGPILGPVGRARSSNGRPPGDTRRAFAVCRWKVSVTAAHCSRIPSLGSQVGSHSLWTGVDDYGR